MLKQAPQKKYRVILQDIKLVDVPTRQNRVFLKAKLGTFHFTTKPIPIKNNIAEFIDPVILEMMLPDDLSKAKHIKKARLSFRLENVSGSGFTRYGVVTLDIIDHILTGELEVRCGLENCSEKPKFSCAIQSIASASHIPLQNIAASPNSQSGSNIPFHRRNNSAEERSFDNSTSFSPTSNSANTDKGPNTRPLSMAFPKLNIPQGFGSMSPIKAPMKTVNITGAKIPVPMYGGDSDNSSTVQSQNSGSTVNGTSSSTETPGAYEWAPVKISYERFLELEHRIDNLLASIINEDSTH